MSEKDVVEERVFVIPLRKARYVGRWKRAPKVVRIVKEYVKRHMKVDDVKLAQEVNEALWMYGVKKPPLKVKVKALKGKEGKVEVKLAS
ncbi:MAG: 50S ribosomal protein L31e [Candidatus Nezhaarchaeales archaeon]